jgi:hypothetical protein
MVERKTRLKPVRKGKTDPKRFARHVREINDRPTAEGRPFPDSTGIIRADRAVCGCFPN